MSQDKKLTGSRAHICRRIHQIIELLMDNFDLRDNVEWKSRLIRGAKLKVRATQSRDYKDCKKTNRLITVRISKVTNYKMPERLVLTNILGLALINLPAFHLTSNRTSCSC